MGNHRHPVTAWQRAATIGWRIASGLFYTAVILGVLAILGAVLYLLGLDGR